MKTIVDEAGEVIAKATDDHTLVGGHHRLAVAASLGKNCSGEIPANLQSLITSSSIMEVLFDTYSLSRSPSAWRMSNAQALIFIAAALLLA
jgi:hypothetical protein